MAGQSFTNDIASNGINMSFSDLDRFGCSWSFQKISRAIEQMDDGIEEVLISFNKGGNYTSLIALCVLIKGFASEEIQTWFDSKLNICPDKKRIVELSEEYYHKQASNPSLIEMHREVKPKTFLQDSNVGFETDIWNCLDKKKLSKINRTNMKNIGIWFCGIYNSQSDEWYMKNLEEKAFPFLISYAKDIREYGSDDPVLESLARMRMTNFLSEMSIYYGGCFLGLYDRIIELDTEQIAKLSSKEYYQLINGLVKEKQKKNLYVSEALIDELTEMIHLIEYFGDDNAYHDGDLKEMKVYLPFLYQLLGRDEDAYNELFRLHKYFGHSVLVRYEFLIVAYRALLLIHDEKKRKRLYSVFDEFYFDVSGSTEVLVVAEDILIFFRKYCEDLREREKLNEVDEDFLIKWSDILPQNMFFVNWIMKNQLTDKLQSLVNTMKTSSGIRQYRAIDDFLSLFNSLSLLKSKDVRIVPKRGKDVLNDPYDWSWKELTDLYTPEEEQQVRTFYVRISKILGHMPSISHIRLYADMKNRIEMYWHMDDEMILCEKLLIGFRGIQSDPFNKFEYDSKGNPLRQRAEDSLNNLMAFFLSSYYGEENVHRERPQGLSSSGKDFGEIDLLVYLNSSQFAIQEALKVTGRDETKLDEHMKRMLVQYDTQGVPVTCLVIYAYVSRGKKFFGDVEDYVKKYVEDKSKFTYRVISPLKNEPVSTGNVSHLSLAYQREEMVQKMHVFTVLM